MFTVFTVRGFVCILARPPPVITKNSYGSPFVTPSDGGLFRPLTLIIANNLGIDNSERLLYY
jgi:hypothetical protein